MDLLFNDIIVITLDDRKPVLRHGYVGIDGRKLAFVGTEPPTEKAARVISGSRKLLLPGLINSHTHLPMALLRGYADDYRLKEWLFEHIFPAEGKLDQRSVAAGVRLGLAECIRFGIVSCTDMYFHLPQIAEAVLESGIKANITNALLCLDMDHFDFEKDRSTIELREMIARYKGAGDGRLIVDAGFHAEYTSGPQAWRECTAFASENNLRFHLHLSETEDEHKECVTRYGKTPAEVFL
jgi:5-methylthioadenosine/S-adenosylhomocysteine deaminase